MTNRRDAYADVGAATRRAIRTALEAPDLSIGEARVLMALMERLTCWSKLSEPVSASVLMAATGMDERSVRRASAALADRGVVDRLSTGGRAPAVYKLPLAGPNPGDPNHGHLNHGSDNHGQEEPSTMVTSTMVNHGQSDHPSEDYARTTSEDSLSVNGHRQPRLTGVTRQQPQPTPSADTEPVDNSAPNAPTGRYPSDFEAWWTLYPRKEAKSAAAKEWRRALGHASWAQLRAGVEAHAAAWRAEGRQQRYIPRADRWLRDRRWEDEPAIAESNATRPRSAAALDAAMAALDKETA